MARAYFRAGLRIELFGEPYRLSHETSDGGWVLEHEKTHRPLERTPEQLFEHYGDKKIRIVGMKPLAIAGEHRHEEPSAEELSPEKLKEFRYRRKFVRAVHGIPHSRGKYKPAILKAWNAMAADERPERVPDWLTVHRWTVAYEASGDNPRSLLSNDARKGNRSQRFPDDVIEVCEQELVAVYLKLERPALSHVTDLAKARVRRLNRHRSPGDQLPMPSAKLMRTVLHREHSAFDIHAARFGPDAAAAKFRAVLHLRKTSAALERGEMDHTQLDLLAIDDDTGVPLGRPWLTLLIDSHTRCILGLCLSFEPPSSSTVAQCLRHAFMPKPRLKEQYPSLTNEWDQFGIVLELVMDGGAEFYTAGLEQVLLELDIEPHWAPRRTPWFKGKIERYNKTQNTATTSAVPGKTFSNLFERDDYDPKKHAVMTMSAIKELIVKWICDVYHRKVHSALKCAPATMWKKSIRPHEVAVMADPERVDALVGTPDTRALDHKGVTYKGLQYNSPELVELRRDLGAELKKVDIRINKSDLGSLIVLHPVTKRPMRAPCLQAEYADGLTEWQHDLCKRYATSQGWDEEDPDSWLDALLTIHELVEEQSALWGGKVHTGRRVGRWKEARARRIAKGGRMPVLPKPDEHPSTAPAPAERTSSALVEAKPAKTSRPRRSAPTPAGAPSSAPVVMPSATTHRPRFIPEVTDSPDEI